VLIAYDRDEAGDAAAEKLADEADGRTGSRVIACCSRKGMDANAVTR
jgi:DNA primase